MAKDTKLADIENKISSLVEKKRRIEEKQKDKILTILNRCNAEKIPMEVLAGAILSASRSFSQNADVVNKWQEEGKKILNPGRGRKKFA
ncbi:MAG TPA: hypothetical protein VI959_01970 [Alphaproteobacteria bacterium]|nr:hypothetical protein [Alphaproteobacteria bacterium]